ncbi:hypothetical protein [Leeia sp.]|uniref:hypothetical protein n=1 Tax=Leeia sp. TaxID=2884678 RepID=UPI0035AF9CC8
MVISGVLEELEVEGYQRLLQIRTAEGPVWVSHLEVSEYLEAGERSRMLVQGSSIAVPVRLCYVLRFTQLDASSDLGFSQRSGSLSTYMTGRVVNRMEPDVYLIDMGGSSVIPVEFEYEPALAVGSIISVTGELATILDLATQ